MDIMIDRLPATRASSHDYVEQEVGTIIETTATLKLAGSVQIVVVKPTAGKKEYTIIVSYQSPQPEKTAREAAREKLLAAGILATGYKTPKNTVALSREELEELGRLAPGAPSIAQIINEDRGD